MCVVEQKLALSTPGFPINDDHFLVNLAQQGHQEAFIELCNRHSRNILRSVMRITKNQEDAEDVVQEALMNAYLHIGAFDGRSQFSTWLTRIAINSALMVLRKKRNRPEAQLTKPVDDSHSSELHPPDKGIDPEAHCVRRQRVLHLREAIGRLRPGLREVVEAHLSLESSIECVAQNVGLSVPATKSRLLRARNSLRTSMARRRLL